MIEGTLARIEKRLMTRTVHRGLLSSQAAWARSIDRRVWYFPGGFDQYRAPCRGHRSRRRRHPGVMP